MQIIIGSDHAGFKVKEKLKQFLKDHRLKDSGTYSEESCDYPIIAKKVAEKVIKNKSMGILICGTGIGMCMAANKVKGIRAALAYNQSSAKKARQHNNANILCLGAREFTIEKLKKITKIFLETKFSNEERHKKRVDEI